VPRPLFRPQAILFDMGGVLLDPAENWDEAGFPLSFPNGLPEEAPLDWFLGMSLEINRNFLAMPIPRPTVDVRPTIAAWLKKRGVTPSPQEIERWHAVLCQWEARPLYPFVKQALTQLRNMGLRLGVVSNTIMPGTYLREHFRRGGIADLFEYMIFSGDFFVNKPDPRIFQHVLDAMHLDARDAWYIGDKPQRDICGAHAAGIFAVLVDSPHHAHIHDRPENVPDLIIKNLGDTILNSVLRTSVKPS